MIFFVIENELFILGTHSLAAKQPIATEAINKSHKHSCRCLLCRALHSEQYLRRRPLGDAMCAAHRCRFDFCNAENMSRCHGPRERTWRTEYHIPMDEILSLPAATECARDPENPRWPGWPEGAECVQTGQAPMGTSPEPEMYFRGVPQRLSDQDSPRTPSWSLLRTPGRLRGASLEALGGASGIHNGPS